MTAGNYFNLFEFLQKNKNNFDFCFGDSKILVLSQFFLSNMIFYYVSNNNTTFDTPFELSIK